jgi:hypothetical protein
MAAATATLPIPSQTESPIQLTLLELVGAVSEVTKDDREVVATVLHMLRSGRIELAGNFRSAPIDDFFS